MFQMRDITFCVKTFNRYSTLWRALSSLKTFAPEASVIVCDDSTEPQEYPDDVLSRITLLKTEPDIGLSAGRNRMQAMVKTPFAFVMDDDHALTKHSGFDTALQEIPRTWLSGIVGFPLRHHNLPTAGGFRFVCKPSPTGSVVTVQRSQEDPVDLVVNNFLAPTSLLVDNPWPENLKLNEHFIWFWDLHVDRKTHVHCMPFGNAWYHMVGDPGRKHPRYRKFRRRGKKEKQKELMRRGIKRLVWGKLPPVVR